MPRRLRLLLPPLLLAVWIHAACSEDVRLGQNFGSSIVVPVADAGGAGEAGGAFGFPLDGVADAAAPPPVNPNPGVCEPVRCGSARQQCGNCIDDDGDGVVDANDPECLGPCDDNEGQLFSGISTRVTGSCRADCYFDLNPGSGDDGCNWSFGCDPQQPVADQGCGYDPTRANCEMDARRASACQAGCLPLVPNGCDCFGCCELPAASGNYIWLGSENLEQAHCELATSMDPTQCRPCTPVAECMNPCGECELCVGKPMLPSSCGNGAPACPPGVTPCDPREAGACGTTHYCITGCCVPLPR